MKIEISIEKNGEEKNGKMKKPELTDEQKMAIGKKLKANGVLTRMERTMLSAYLLEEEDD
jgi:hypothetical protein